MTGGGNFYIIVPKKFWEAILMIKKFFAAMVLAFALVIVGGGKADAAEIYVGNYSDGTPVYFLPQTLGIESYSPWRFYCTVRAGRDYLNYNFYPYNGSPYYRNSEGYSGYVFGGQSPVAANIYRHVINNYH